MKELKRVGGILASDEPKDGELLFSGSASLVDIPLEAATYYLLSSSTVPDYWQKITINPAVFNEINFTLRSGSSGRTATQYMAGFYAEASKINDTTIRLRFRYHQLNFGVAATGTRNIRRVIKAVG